MNALPRQPRQPILFADADEDCFTRLALWMDEIAPRRFYLNWAGTYAFAVTALKRGRFPLAIVGSYLGPRSGSELLTHIRMNAPETPVIMLTRAEELLVSSDRRVVECLDRDRLTINSFGQVVKDALSRAEIACGVPQGTKSSATIVRVAA